MMQFPDRNMSRRNDWGGEDDDWTPGPEMGAEQEEQWDGEWRFPVPKVKRRKRSPRKPRAAPPKKHRGMKQEQADELLEIIIKTDEDLMIADNILKAREGTSTYEVQYDDLVHTKA